MPPDLERLRDLLVGNTIEAVDPPDGEVDEAIAKITVRKDGKLHEFHLHATDLGWWIGEHRSLRDDGDGNLAPLWENFDEMIEAMTDHLRSDAMDDWPPEESSFESYDDSLTRAIGFRCKHTDRAWWASFQATRRAAVRVPGTLDSPARRRQVAAFVGLNHRLPHDAEELSA